MSLGSGSAGLAGSGSAGRAGSGSAGLAGSGSAGLAGSGSAGLAGELTVRTVAAARDELVAWLDGVPEGEAVTLDLGAVDEVDTAGLQLLVAVAASLGARGGSLRLDPVSPAVTETLAFASLDTALAPTASLP